MNWPELNKFCGCCSLNTGIYIFGVYQVMVGIFITWTDVEHVIAMSNYLQIDNEDKSCHNVTGIVNGDSGFLMQYRYKGFEEADFMIVARLLMIHLMGWVLLRAAVLMSMILMLYGTYKSKPQLIKFYLTFNVPSWVFTTYIIALNLLIMNHFRKCLAITYTFLTAYQLLAARSAYRIMTGKSKFYKEGDLNLDTHVEPVMTTMANQQDSPTVQQRQITTPIDSRHCETCLCGYTLLSQNNISPNAYSPVTNAVEANDGEPNADAEYKELNFKEDPIVFDQNQLIQRNNPILEETHSSKINPRYVRKSDVAIRPNTLAVGKYCGSCKEKKHIIFDEVAVIYDPAQLNVGTSPILEDNTTNKKI